MNYFIKALTCQKDVSAHNTSTGMREVIMIGVWTAFRAERHVNEAATACMASSLCYAMCDTFIVS